VGVELVLELHAPLNEAKARPGAAFLPPKLEADLVQACAGGAQMSPELVPGEPRKARIGGLCFRMSTAWHACCFEVGTMNHHRVANDELGWIKWGALAVIVSLSSSGVAQERANPPNPQPAEPDANTNRPAEGGTEPAPEAAAEQRQTADAAPDGQADGTGDGERDNPMEPTVSDNSEQRSEPPGGTAEVPDMSNPPVETAAGMGSDVTYADRGVVELGGTLGLDIRDEALTLRIAPSVGYFLLDRFELTLLPIITVVNVDDDPGPTETTVSFSVVLEPSYHLPFSDSFYGFAGLGLGVAFEEGPGADFLLRPVLGMDILIGRSGILKPYGFLDVGLGNGALGGGFMAGYTVMF